MCAWLPALSRGAGPPQAELRAPRLWRRLPPPKVRDPFRRLGQGPVLPRFPAQVVGCPPPRLGEWRPPAESSGSLGAVGHSHCVAWAITPPGELSGKCAGPGCRPPKKSANPENTEQTLSMGEAGWGANMNTQRTVPPPQFILQSEWQALKPVITTQPVSRNQASLKGGASRMPGPK